MSMYGIEFVKNASRLLEVDGEADDLQFQENGYLFLASSERGEAVLRGETLLRGVSRIVC